MATATFTLKPAKTYTDPLGNVLTGAYAIVDSFELNRRNKTVRFTLNVFKDRAARVANRRACNEYSFEVYSSDYDTYFSPSVLAATFVWSAIQSYLVNVGLAQTDIVVADWQLDSNPEP